MKYFRVNYRGEVFIAMDNPERPDLYLLCSNRDVFEAAANVNYSKYKYAWNVQKSACIVFKKIYLGGE